MHPWVESGPKESERKGVHHGNLPWGSMCVLFAFQLYGIKTRATETSTAKKQPAKTRIPWEAGVGDGRTPTWHRNLDLSLTTWKKSTPAETLVI